MRKTIAAIALTLALGAGVPAKTHHHHQEATQGISGNISDTNAWRHYLLHVAANLPTTTITLPSNLYSDTLAVFNTAMKFRAEFERPIDDFNADGWFLS